MTAVINDKMFTTGLARYKRRGDTEPSVVHAWRTPNPGPECDRRLGRLRKPLVAVAVVEDEDITCGACKRVLAREVQ